MGKPSACEKTGQKKGVWTPEEDMLLLSYITRYGHWNWHELPKYAGLLRCGKSCRLRWMNYLRPGIKRGNFTRQEEELIIKMQEQLGNRWSAIAASLPGRTDNDIKNHWHTCLNKPMKLKSSAAKKDKKKPVACEALSRNESQISSHLANIAPVILESSAVIPTSTPMASDMPHLSVEENSFTGNLATEDESGISSVDASIFGTDFWSEPFLIEEAFMWEDMTSNSELENGIYPCEVYDGDHGMDNVRM